jgi:hypothetical protein
MVMVANTRAEVGARGQRELAEKNIERVIYFTGRH